jgi:hypothetical protein
MPRAARAAKKKSEIDPDSLWVCWMSGSAEVDGENVSFHQGQRLRGDSPPFRAARSISSRTALPRAGRAAAQHRGLGHGSAVQPRQGWSEKS